MNRVLIVDNFDSFTFNLVQLIGSLGSEVYVQRNNTDLENLIRLNPTHLIISPGPGNPSHAGISMSAMDYFKGRIPVLGVCLGLQVMGSLYGVEVVRADEAVHGQQSKIFHDGRGVFKDLSNPCLMARYHSLILSSSNSLLNSEFLEVTATCENLDMKIVMGIRHKFIANFEAVQFHPESFLSPEGSLLLSNFLSLRDNIGGATVPSPPQTPLSLLILSLRRDLPY